METYIIIEKQDANSTREGEKIKAANLTEAKKRASRNKSFVGTTLEIQNEDGVPICRKAHGFWRDINK